MQMASLSLGRSSLLMALPIKLESIRMLICLSTFGFVTSPRSMAITTMCFSLHGIKHLTPSLRPASPLADALPFTATVHWSANGTKLTLKCVLGKKGFNVTLSLYGFPYPSIHLLHMCAYLVGIVPYLKILFCIILWCLQRHRYHNIPSGSLNIWLTGLIYRPLQEIYSISMLPCKRHADGEWRRTHTVVCRSTVNGVRNGVSHTVLWQPNT